jgi:hypothetical protein
VQDHFSRKLVAEVSGLAAACFGKRRDAGGPLPSGLESGTRNRMFAHMQDFDLAFVKRPDLGGRTEILSLHF